MDKSAVVGLLKRPWVGFVAIIVAILLGAFAMPAHSADLYLPPPAPIPHFEGAAFPPPCPPCGCAPCCPPCGCGPCGCCVQRGVIERAWVDHVYFERRLDGGWPPYGPVGFGEPGFGPPGFGGPGPGYGPPGYGPPGYGYGGFRPRLGYGGINYSPPIAPEYRVPRVPVGMSGPYNNAYNGGFSNAGYFQ